MDRRLKFDVAKQIVMGRSRAEGFLADVAELSAAEHGISISYAGDGNTVVGEGLCADFAGSLREGEAFPVFVGTGGLASGKGRAAGVSGIALTKGVVAACHEVYHVKQAVEEQSDMSPEGIDRSLCHLATLRNPRFYHVYYAQNRREMEAEAHAIRSARDVMSDLVGPGDADRLMLEYVAWRTLPDEVPDGPDDHVTHVAYPVYFIPPADTDDGYYASVDDVLARLDDAIAMERSGQYCSNTCLGPQAGHKLRDEYIRVMEPQVRPGQPRGPWFGTFNEFQAAPDQATSYRMLACLTCWLDPSYKAAFGNLSEVDLRPDAVFGHSFPESRESVLERLLKEEAGLDGKPVDRPKRRLVPGWMRDLFNRSERDFGTQFEEGGLSF